MINSYILKNYPWPHIVGKFNLNFSYNDLLKYIDAEPDSNFQITKNENFQKKEYRLNNGFLGQVNSLIQSKEVVEICESNFLLKNLQIDRSLDGGGLTITEKDGFLRYHIDFPYSSSVGLYRVVNTLLYLNDPKSLVGGDLHLLDPYTKTVEGIIKPEFGVFVAFPTSKFTPHGHSMILEGKRLSINSYLYMDQPLDNRTEPTKTEWL